MDIDRIAREIKILKKIRHPRIIQLYQIIETESELYLIMEHANAGELFDYIVKYDRVDDINAANFFNQILEGVEHLHANGVCHRDLKPENLILASKDNDSDLRIADFGLASFIKDGEMLKLRCGSPGYVAPELLDDIGYDKKADIFSAGVIFYVLLTGRPVFRGYNINEILLKNKKCEVEYPSKYWDKISDKAKDLVNKMLHKDPAERISAEEALKHPWFTQDEHEIGDEVLDFAAAHEEDKEQFANIDYSKINDAEEEDIKLVTCTPVMAKRNLQPTVPETPFMTTNNFNRNNATPIMTKGIVI